MLAADECRPDITTGPWPGGLGWPAAAGHAYQASGGVFSSGTKVGRDKELSGLDCILIFFDFGIITLKVFIQPRCEGQPVTDSLTSLTIAEGSQGGKLAPAQVHLVCLLLHHELEWLEACVEVRLVAEGL